MIAGTFLSILLLAGSVGRADCQDFLRIPLPFDPERFEFPTLTWESLGPYGGTVTVITHHPHIVDLVYLGTFGQGLLYSRDGGQAWQHVYETNAPINFILIDPFDPSVVLVGASNWYQEEGYLHRSSDWGLTWEKTFYGKMVIDAAFDPVEPGLLYMTVQGESGGMPAYFYRSTDHGQTWFNTNPGGTWEAGSFVWSFSNILVSSIDGSILCSTMWDTGMGIMEDHVCRSTDGGYNWEYEDQGLFGEHAWDFAWANPRIALAGTRDGLYAHVPGGNLWHRIPAGLPGLNCTNLAPGPVESVMYAIVADEDDQSLPDVVHRSTNRGISWTPLPLIDDSAELLAVSTDPHAQPGTETILAGSWEAGVFESTGPGESWVQRTAGFRSLPCLSFDFGPPGSGLLYAGVDGLFHAGLYRSSDFGGSWEIANDSIPGGRISAIQCHPTDEQIVFAANEALGIYRSTDRGDSWLRLDNGLPEYYQTFCLLIDHSNPSTVYAGTGEGLYRSTDGGDSWTLSGTGMAAQYVRDIDYDYLDPSHLFAAVYVDGVYESTDGGENWELVLEDTLWNDFVSVAVAPGGDRVYAGMLFTPSFYRSLDAGDRWEVVLDHPAVTILVPDDAPQTVVCAGEQTGIRGSVNGGDDWFLFPEGGLSEQNVNHMGVPPESSLGYLLVASSSGIKRLVAQ